jgi:hypothetical protein
LNISTKVKSLSDRTGFCFLRGEEDKKRLLFSQQSFFANSITQLLSSLNLAEGTAIVGHALLAHTVGHTESTALGASNDTGSLQLPHVAAALIAASLRSLSLRDGHVDTSLQ